MLYFPLLSIAGLTSKRYCFFCFDYGIIMIEVSEVLVIGRPQRLLALWPFLLTADSEALIHKKEAPSNGNRQSEMV